MTTGKIILAGGTGFIGTPLVSKLLDSGYEVVLLVRGAARPGINHPKLRRCVWDGKSLGPWTAELESAKAIINLCGTGIADQKWTEGRKREILDSRIRPLQALAQAAIRSVGGPKTLITASAVGFYGDLPSDQVAAESRPHGRGFLAETCVQWEKTAQTVIPFGIRTVILRFGVVLAAEGGALPKFLKPFRAGVGGPLGSGRQILSWIHRDDAVAAVIHALEMHEVSGPVNVTAPHPATMKDFCAELGRAMHRPSWLPVPGFVLKSMMGEMAEVVLSGQRAVPRKLMDTGFKFRYPELEIALKNTNLGGTS